MDRPVVTVTRLDDLTADLVIAELHRRGVPVVRLDPGDFPGEVGLAAFLDESGLYGHVTTTSRKLTLSAVRSVYWRRPSPCGALHGLDPQMADWAAAQAHWGLGGVLASLPGALYVNHPWRIRDAESKPAQLAAAAGCGFTVPPSVISNDLAIVRAFVARYGRVVYKPLWNTPVRTDDGSARTVWVRRVDPADLDDSISATAHLFQAEVDKVADVRTTAVDGRLFSVRIDGAISLDWREDYSALSYSMIDTPPAVEKGVHAYLDHFGLAYGAFDFGLGRDPQDWHWYECNPSGQWAFFDSPITERITLALADLLQEGRQ